MIFKNIDRNWLIVALFMVFSLQISCAEKVNEPTAIIADAETGEPIEGAVAIAIWRKHSTKEAAWFEGGKMVPVRIEEVVSDKEGKIYIEDFWGWHFYDNRYPRLTVYKFGYVCWDQKNTFQVAGFRDDFNEDNRMIRMKKWPEDFSYVKHWSFIQHCTGHGDLNKAENRIFNKAFENEQSYRLAEKDGLLIQENKQTGGIK